MKFAPPFNQRLGVRSCHKACGKRAPQGVDGQEHRCVRGHFDGTELDQAKTPIGHERIEKFVHADLRLMGVAMEVEQKIPQDRINECGIGGGWHRLDRPESDGKGSRNLKEALVNSGGLGGGPDETTAEEIR